MGDNAQSYLPRDEYILPRDNSESLRLVAQHYILVQRQDGWLLHPTVAAAVAKMDNPQVADAAAGTGIWSSELALRYPSANIVGLDISRDQFPPPHIIPSNVSLEQLDLLDEIPSHLQGKFDVVHVRLLSPAGPGLSRDKLIDSFHKLLRPGGWLQWDDLLWPVGLGVAPSKDGQGLEISPLPANEPMMKTVDKLVQMSEKIAWFADFNQVITSNGLFHNPETFKPAVIPHLTTTETTMALGSIIPIMKMIIETAGITDEALIKEATHCHEHLQNGAKQGRFLAYNWQVAIAQKVG